MDLSVWILSFLMIFMLHNLEEIITVEKWIQQSYPRVQDKIPMSIRKELNKYKEITSVNFAVVVLVVSLFASVFILISVVTEQYYLFLGISLFFALNIFTHPLQAIYLRCYTPGLLTSLILIIPFYSLFFYQFYDTNILNFDSIVRALIVMIFSVPVFLLSHKIGEKWD